MGITVVWCLEIINKKYMRDLLILLIVILSITQISCKDEVEINQDNTCSIKYRYKPFSISSIGVDHFSIQEFSYNSDNRLYRIYSYDLDSNLVICNGINNCIDSVNFLKSKPYDNTVYLMISNSYINLWSINNLIINFEYYGEYIYNNAISHEDNFIKRHEKFTYNGNNLIKIDFTDKNLYTEDQRSGSEIFTYQNNKPKNSSYTLTSQYNTISIEKTFTYDLSNNLTQIKLKRWSKHLNNVENNSIDTTILQIDFSEFDNLENPYKSLFYVNRFRLNSIFETNYSRFDYSIYRTNDYNNSFKWLSILKTNSNNVTNYPDYSEGYFILYDCDTIELNDYLLKFLNE